MPSFPYSLVREIRQSGLLGLCGWLALFAIAVAGLVVVVRHALNPACHLHGTHFYSFAHVCFLIFLNNSILFALQWTHAGTVLISLAIGISVALASVLAVSAVLRRLPKPGVWPCLGFTCVSASIALFAALMLTVLHGLS